MSSSVPNPTYDSSVDDFGIGTYDSHPSKGLENETQQGRSESSPNGESIPTVHDSSDTEFYYVHATTNLPGDSLRPPKSKRPEEDVYDRVAQSGLPIGAGDPPPRTDYYDKTSVSSYVDDMWSDNGDGAYASSELPGVQKNEESVSNGLSALGNSESGYSIEDMTDTGFPSQEFIENYDYGNKARESIPRNPMNKRTATNHELVKNLCKEFISFCKGKPFSKRDVLFYLKRCGQPQHLSSDMLRFMTLSGNGAPDVLDAPRLLKDSVIKVSSVRASLEDASGDFEVKHVISSLDHINFLLSGQK